MRLPRWLIVLLPSAAMLAGCAGTDHLKYFGDDQGLSYYKDVAQTIDYPDINAPGSQEARTTAPPRTVLMLKQGKVRKLSLTEAIHIALQNNRIIRSRFQFQGGGSTLVANANTGSVYDPAIQETNVLFGGRGVEAALAEFDTTFSTSILWGRSEDVQNNLFFGAGTTPGNTLQQDTAAFRSALAKRFADGGSFVVGHDWNYRGALLPGSLFGSTYTGNVRAAYRRPLWAGSGVEFTRTAGAVNPNFGAIAGVSQGVVIARINNDISLADFEASVRNLVKDVEDLYWDLYLAYRRYNAAVVARDSAQRTWSIAKTKRDIGVRNFNPQDEPQARDQYFEAKAAADTRLNELYLNEIALRRLMGLPVNDEAHENGGILRPADEPQRGKVVLDWRESLMEALMQRLELRRQKWGIKSLELQLNAAQSLTNPRFDFVSEYRVNGFGDRLFGENDNDGTTAQGLRSAYETLTQGDQTTWSLGFEFSMPIGFRSAKAQVRNLELRLLKARELLAVQELDISHELASAFQSLDANYATVKSNFERIGAARERARIVEDQYKKGLTVAGVPVTADIVLRAQRSLAQAESDFFASLVEYNKALVNVQYRKGSLLAYNNIHLAEHEWTPEAYTQAMRRAKARSHAFENYRLLHTEPSEMATPGRTGGGAYYIGDDQKAMQPGSGSDDVAPPAPQPIPKGQPMDPKPQPKIETHRTRRTPRAETIPTIRDVPRVRQVGSSKPGRPRRALWDADVKRWDLSDSPSGVYAR